MFLPYPLYLSITKHYYIMLKKNLYESPKVRVIALTLEGAIAGSDPEKFFDVNDPFDTDEEEW